MKLFADRHLLRSIVFFFFLMIFSAGIQTAFAAAVKKKKTKGIEEILQIFSEQQPVVSSGSKIPVRQSEAPYSVTVITSKDIETYQPLGLIDLLKRVQGVDQVEMNDAIAWSNIRGIIDSVLHQIRTLFIVDGIPLWVTIAGTSLPNELPVSLDDIARIEIIRTPTTVSGGDAVEGIISITTKKPREAKGVRASFGFGSQGTRHDYLSYADSVGNLGYRLSLSNYTSNVWRADFFDAPNIIPPVPNPYERRSKISTRLNYRDGANEYNFSYGYTDGYASFTANTPADILTDFKQGLAAFTYINHLSENSQFLARISHNFFTADGFTEYFGVMLPLNFTQNRDEIGIEHYFPWGKNQTFSYGVNYYRYYTSNSPDPTPPFVVPPAKQSLGFDSANVDKTGWGAYVQNRSDLTASDHLYYGARYDKDWTGESGFAPFASFVHMFNQGVSFRANANMAYRFPDVTELYGNFTLLISNPFPSVSPLPFFATNYGSVFATGRLLEPEKVTNYEMAYGGEFSDHFKGSINLYLKNVNNYIDRQGFTVSPADCFPVPDQNCLEFPPFTTNGIPVIMDVRVPRNIPNVQIAGAELSTEYRVSKDFSVYGNYRNQTAGWRVFPFQEAVLGMTTTEEKIKSSPQAIATLGLKYFDDRWNGFVEAQSYDEREIPDAGALFVIKGNTVVNLGATFPVVDDFKLGLAAYDVFNSPEINPWSGVTIGGRFQLTMQYGF